MALLTPDELHATLDDVVRRLADALRPREVYLFGSYAYGSPGRDSDLDFLVVVEESPLSPFQRDAVAYAALGEIPIPIDVQVYTRAEFDRRASLPVSFERTVRTKGRLLYAA
jgi:predicted nucleotidyltransferase